MLRCGNSLGRSLLRLTFFIAFLLLLSAAAFSQDQPTPKTDIFVGYQWLNPGGSVPAPDNPSSSPVPLDLTGMGKGLGGAVAYNFDRHFALEADFGHNWNDLGYESTYSVGPRLMLRTEGMNFFVHSLLSLNRLNVDNLASDNGVGAILGGGMDLPLWPHLSIRLFEADFVWAHHHFPDFADETFPDLRRPTLDGVRLRGGLLFNLGGAPVVPPSASCAVQPSEVMVGEPVTATATVTNANPKHTLVYSWSGNGGKVTGKDNTASIDTNGVAGGSYTVTAHVSDPKMKKGGEVSCSANYTVKEPPKNPPTMSCSANPTTVQAGGTSTLSCTCTSPDNVPVTVSGWSATGGNVSGGGSTATLNTTGAPAGPITVSATCSDPRGLSASSSTQVTVEVPPPPPPQASKLSECEFPNEKKPWRVDNTCKAVLDDVAKNLQQNADNKLVIVGNADPTEKRKNLAGERAVDAKAYLSGGEAKQAIDASRIETRTGSAGTKTTEFWVVPAGATFSAEGTQPVDETTVKPVPDHPKPAAKKKAAKP
jgi:outer membrane protein OmpA-like peptidoglycan-associated protein